MKKSTNIIRIVLQIILSLSFLMAAFAKLTGNAQEVALFTATGLSSTLIAIGILELIVPVMLWFKTTRIPALLLATAIMGAAFAETITSIGGLTIEVLAPGFVLLIIWAIFAIDYRHRTA